MFCLSGNRVSAFLGAAEKKQSNKEKHFTVSPFHRVHLRFMLLLFKE